MRSFPHRFVLLSVILLSLLVPSLAWKSAPAGEAVPSLSTAWKLYRAGEIYRAREIFEKALEKSPDNVEALNGLGYVALREGDLEGAAGYFGRALRLRPADRDGLFGMALVAYRKGKLSEAVSLLEKILVEHPGDGEARETLERVKRALASVRGGEVEGEVHLPPGKLPEKVQMPMRVRRRFFEIRQPDGSWRPVFLKAVNLGAALPGRFPSQFPEDPSLYRYWFEKMKECGFHAVRVYTIFPPVFYDELKKFNEERPGDPLYLIHGVWAEPPPDNDFSSPDYVESFRAEMRRVVDLLHGALDLPPRPGHAHGSYRADVSRWWIATILGREWEPDVVQDYLSSHPGEFSFEGRFVRGENLNAMEKWLAGQTEYFLAYEFDRWKATRPIAWTNWPTLDPLFHPTESTKEEEEEWRIKLGLPPEPGGVREYDNDAVGLDMEKFREGEENRAGLFASYHAYPYYPDFMNYDPVYLRARDEEGPNAYLGYLRDLASHHRSHPLFIAEFGVPTSREIAHFQPQGWTHGGHSEVDQGRIDLKLFRTIYEAGCAGGSLFAWIDEWFKHNWLVIDYHIPFERNRLWHDRQDAEQNYGLVAYRAGNPGPAAVIDGKGEEWAPRDVILSSSGEGPVRSLSIRSDESDLYLLLKLNPGANAGVAVVFDVVAPDLGEFRFPAGIRLSSEVGLEAALLFDGERARFLISRSYDRQRNRFRREIRPRRSLAGDFVPPLMKPQRRRITRKGEVIPERVLDVSYLREGTTDRNSPDYDDRAEWFFNQDTGTAEFRIPWGMFNVTDPSSRSVLFEGRGGDGGVRKTEGFRVAVAAYVPDGSGEMRASSPAALQTLPPAGEDGVVRNLPLYSWEEWEEPDYHSFLKRSWFILRDGLREIPDSPLVK